MVEVFKTNVQHRWHANMLVNEIHKTFKNYTANFDLEDCDNILRVKCTAGHVQPLLLINLLRHFGFTAEVLPDEVHPSTEAIQQFVYSIFYQTNY